MVQICYLRAYFGIDFFSSSVAMDCIENGLKLGQQQDTHCKNWLVMVTILKGYNQLQKVILT